MDETFLFKPSELTLTFEHPEGRRALSFGNAGLSYSEWRVRCLAKFKELLGLEDPTPGPVRELRSTVHEGVRVRALLMSIGKTLTLPAYLLHPESNATPRRTVMALHGHGVKEMEGPLGLKEGYHKGFALKMAQAGFRVLSPFHRGFGILRDLARDHPEYSLEYEQSMHFPYVMDTLSRGYTVVGQNVEDLLRWEHWLAVEHGAKEFAAVGASYGGDLALAYPAFSKRVERIFCSGSTGAYGLHFKRCFNGPAHCIPGFLKWMERSDIVGLNAPRPLVMHYGERDTPKKVEGPKMASAAYNESVPGMMREAQAIYAAAGAKEQVQLVVTPNAGHVLDMEAVFKLLGKNTSPDDDSDESMQSLLTARATGEHMELEVSTEEAKRQSCCAGRDCVVS